MCYGCDLANNPKGVIDTGIRFIPVTNIHCRVIDQYGETIAHIRAHSWNPNGWFVSTITERLDSISLRIIANKLDELNNA